MGFGLNAAMMAGVNDGLRQGESDQFLRDQRVREAKTADLNQQVLTSQVEDMNRTRADQAAVRGAAAGAYRRDAETTAAGGIPEGRAGSITAMREAAAARGDVNTVQQLDAAYKNLQDEGIVAVTKAALMGQDGPELGKVFNSYGTFRVDPATVKVDPNGNITGNKADGTPFQGFNLAKMAVLTGLVKPDEWASAGDGQTFNKRTGQVQGSRVMKPGEVLATPSGGFGAQVPFAPKDSAVVVPEGSNVVTLGQGGVPTQSTGDQPTITPPTKIRKTISDEVDSGFKGPMGELSGTADVRDRQKVLAEQIWSANRTSGFTEAMSVEAARAVQSGKAQTGTFKLPDGSSVRGFQFNGQNVFLSKPQATEAAPAQKPASSGGAPAAKPAVPKPAAVAARASVPAAAPAPAATGRPAGFVEIPEPPPAGRGSAKAFDDWYAQYGEQYERNQKLLEEQAAQAEAARRRGPGLKERLKASQAAGTSRYADGGPVRKKAGFGAC